MQRAKQQQQPPIHPRRSLPLPPSITNVKILDSHNLLTTPPWAKTNLCSRQYAVVCMYVSHNLLPKLSHPLVVSLWPTYICMLCWLRC